MNSGEKKIPKTPNNYTFAPKKWTKANRFWKGFEMRMQGIAKVSPIYYGFWPKSLIEWKPSLSDLKYQRIRIWWNQKPVESEEEILESKEEGNSNCVYTFCPNLWLTLELHIHRADSKPPSKGSENWSEIWAVTQNVVFADWVQPKKLLDNTTTKAILFGGTLVSTT